jgi:hypothetical protein
VAADAITALIPKVPTARDMLRQALPKELRDSYGDTGIERRRKPRVSIADINAGGVDAIRQAYPDLKERLDTFRTQPAQEPSVFEKALHLYDFPRNVVGSVIGEIAGVETENLPRGAFGLPRVSMSDVLGKLGVKDPVVKAVLGFLGDVATDPLTYVTAGAATGLKAAKWIPRLGPELVSALKNVARGIKVAPEMEAALKAALGVRAWAEVVGAAARGEAKRLMGRAGGSLTRALAENALRTDAIGEGARNLLAMYGLKGRPLFRIPFTNIAGPTLPFGEAARAYRAVTEPGVAQALARAQRFQRGMSAARQAAQTALAAKATAPIGEGAALTKAATAATERAERYGVAYMGATRGPEAPDILRLVGESRWGAESPNRLVNWVARTFGVSPLKSQILALGTKATIGNLGARLRSIDLLEPQFERLSTQLAAKGYGAGNPTKVRELFARILDLGDEKNIAKLTQANQVVEREVWRVNRLADMLKEPGVAQLKAQVDARMGELLGELQKAGVKVSKADLGYYARVLTPEARAELGAQRYAAPMLGQFGGRGVPGGGSIRHRDVAYELSRKTPQGIEFRTLPRKARAASRAELAKLAKDGWLPTAIGLDKNGNQIALPVGQTLAERKRFLVTQGIKKVLNRTYPVSIAGYEEIVQKGGLGALFGRGTIAGKPIGITKLKGKPIFEMDPVKALSAREGQQETIKATAELNRLVAENGVPVSKLSDADFRQYGLRVLPPVPPDHPMAGIMGTDFLLASTRGVAVPEPVARMVENYMSIWEGNRLPSALAWTDRTLGWFKRWALYHPAFLIRNAWQNVFGGVMEGGNPARAFKYWTRDPASNAAMKAIAAGDLARLRTMTINLGGEQWRVYDLAKGFVDHNGAFAGRYTGELAPDLLRGGGTLKGIGRKGLQTQRGVTEFVRRANAALETRMRWGWWLSFIDDGMSPRDAFMKVLKAMPDQTDMTILERNVMRRIWPWWSWLRSNGSLQLLYYLPQKPAFIASVSKLQNFMEGLSGLWRGTGETVPTELRPEWMREQQAAQVAGGPEGGGAFLLSSWFPFQEVQGLAAGLASPSAAARQWVSTMRPGLKVAAEMAAGRDIFRGRDVQPFSWAEAAGMVPAALTGQTGTPLDSLLTIRPIREYGVRVGQQPTVGRAISRALLGGAYQPISREAGLRDIDIQTGGALQRLRSKLVRARENRDTAEARNINRQMMMLYATRQRLGLAVPRAIQAGLAALGARP